MRRGAHGPLCAVEHMALYAPWSTWPFMRRGAHGPLCAVEHMALARMPRLPCSGIGSACTLTGELEVPHRSEDAG